MEIKLFIDLKKMITQCVKDKGWTMRYFITEIMQMDEKGFTRRFHEQTLKLKDLSRMTTALDRQLQIRIGDQELSNDEVSLLRKQVDYAEQLVKNQKSALKYQEQILKLLKDKYDISDEDLLLENKG